MFFPINVNNGIVIYEPITIALEEETFNVGQTLPRVRDVSVHLAINLNKGDVDESI